MSKETITQRAARAWADMACWTEQHVEQQAVVTPELTEALQEAKAKAKHFRQLADQERSEDGDE